MATVEDGVLVFLPCEEIEGVQHITARIGRLPDPIWHARGEDGVFGPDTPITYGIVPDGFVTDVGPDPLRYEFETIHFSLVNTAVDSRTWIIDGDELVPGKWLDQDGRLHDEPCR